MKTAAKARKGSSSSYAGWEPRTCDRCGRPIVKASEAAMWGKNADGSTHGRHMACLQPPRH